MSAQQKSRRGDAHTDAVWALAWLSASVLLTGSVDGSIKQWEVNDKDELVGPKWTLSEGEFPMGVVSIVRLGEDSFAASSMDGIIRICKGGAVVKRIEAGPVDCWTLCASDDGKRIASGTYTGAINIWDVESGALVDTINSGGGFGLAVAWKNNQIALGTKDGGVYQVDLSSEDKEARPTKGKVHHLPVRSLCYSRDGSRLYSASDDGLAAAITADGGEKIGTLKGHLSWVLGVDAGEGIIATGCADKKVRFWDAETGAVISQFEAHSGQCFCVAFNPSGKLLASGGASGDIQLFAFTSK